MLKKTALRVTLTTIVGLGVTCALMGCGGNNGQSTEVDDVQDNGKPAPPPTAAIPASTAVPHAGVKLTGP